LINRWKKELHEGGRTIFGSPKRKERETEVLQAALYEEIGRLKFELDWLKKKLLLSVIYYQPACASPENLQLMRLMDEQYLKTPFYGSPRLTVWLNSRGLAVNRNGSNG
jgi:putative transposase